MFQVECGRAGRLKAIFHLGYVAGIVDAIETLRGASFITREQLSEALAKIETCDATD